MHIEEVQTMKKKWKPGVVLKYLRLYANGSYL